MAVPDYQAFMLPLLSWVSTGDERRVRDSYKELADTLNLGAGDREELLPSGKQVVFQNRIGWARTYMVKAGLIIAPRRGFIQITDRGRKLLAEKPDRIDSELLERFPEFVEFKTTRVNGQSEGIDDQAEETSKQTPEEILETANRELRRTLAHGLLAQVKQTDPSFFERLVVDLLVRMGYGGSREDAGRVVGRSGDGGIDGIINEDRLGLDTIYIQAKRWENIVSRPEVQKFVGALQGQKAKKGVFITTSNFSKEAVDFAHSIENRVILIDGDRLAQLMIDFDVGVTPVETYVTKRIDMDYFEAD